MSNTLLKNGKYEILKEIGAGAHGKIFLVRDTQNDVKKALKRISNCDEKIQKEAKILQECDSLCPYILKYFDSFSDQCFNIVFEFHMFGDLRGVINDEINKRKSGVPSKKVKYWSKQQLEALDFIHSRNILHRDIKPENILLNNYGDVILGDFGVAAHADSISKTTVGSYNYISPEILNGEEYDSRIDIWSFGCVVYELFTLKKAFDGSLAQLMRKITECEIEFPSFQNEPEVEIMIKNSIKKNATDRLSAGKILEKLDKKNGDRELFKKAEKYYKEGELLIEEENYILKFKTIYDSFRKNRMMKKITSNTENTP